MGITTSKANITEMDEEIVEFVKEQINENKVIVFSKTFCPYCIMAKKALNEVNAEFKVIELEKHPNGPKIQDILLNMTGARSVPRVFINGTCIGGGSETRDLLKSGELKKMIEA